MIDPSHSDRVGDQEHHFRCWPITSFAALQHCCSYHGMSRRWARAPRQPKSDERRGRSHRATHA